MYKNSEGYADPVMDEILKKEKERFKHPWVYICSPYRGDVQKNTAVACKVCRIATTNGLVPIAPHLYFPRFLDDDNWYERDVGLKMGVALLKRCTEMWIIGTKVSEGMEFEIERAKKMPWIKMRHFIFTDGVLEEVDFDEYL